MEARNKGLKPHWSILQQKFAAQKLPKNDISWGYGEFYLQKYAEDDCSIATADESDQRYPSGPIPERFEQSYLLYLLWVILYRVLLRCITVVFGQIISKTFFCLFLVRRRSLLS